jgi:hypothetical protein
MESRTSLRDGAFYRSGNPSSTPDFRITVCWCTFGRKSGGKPPHSKLGKTQ